VGVSWITALLLRRGRTRRVRRGDPWDGGLARPNARMQYSSVAFAQPMRQVFGGLFDIQEELSQDENGHWRYRLQVRDPLWDRLYTPIARAVNASARRVTRLQSGNVRIYLGWSLATLVVLLWLTS
jgi:hypothetical protein